MESERRNAHNPPPHECRNEKGNMKESRLSQDDLDALQTSGLHRKTPFGVRDVSRTQMSIARYYGGITYNGDHFTYFAECDELVRDDALKFLKGRKRKA